jgi:hypothetical protein
VKKSDNGTDFLYRHVLLPNLSFRKRSTVILRRAIKKLLFSAPEESDSILVFYKNKEFQGELQQMIHHRKSKCVKIFSKLK